MHPETHINRVPSMTTGTRGHNIGVMTSTGNRERACLSRSKLSVLLLPLPFQLCHASKTSQNMCPPKLGAWEDSLHEATSLLGSPLHACPSTWQLQHITRPTRVRRSCMDLAMQTEQTWWARLHEPHMHHCTHDSIVLTIAQTWFECPYNWFQNKISKVNLSSKSSVDFQYQWTRYKFWMAE